MTKEHLKILVLFYSLYGHTYRLVQDVVQGIKAENATPMLRIVEELMPKKYMNKKAKEMKEQLKDIPIANPREDLKDIDGIIVGTPTRFGNMCAQMRNFWDQTGGDWVKGSLIGKPAGIFASTNTQHGGQETTIITTMITLLHHGCIIVGTPYSNLELMEKDTITGGTPYGPTTVAGPNGERMPIENELNLARMLGRRVTKIARKLI
ncbi:MAG: NAD(P)H:quinone oxidoreductase [Candidatus Lokiarchaeota archaeon]|nr:NAD(P)H:quinone oxidoreductase [Candidatus Lokiarchaeota archaeon]